MALLVSFAISEHSPKIGHRKRRPRERERESARARVLSRLSRILTEWGCADESLSLSLSRLWTISRAQTYARGLWFSLEHSEVSRFLFFFLSPNMGRDCVNTRDCAKVRDRSICPLSGGQVGDSLQTCVAWKDYPIGALAPSRVDAFWMTTLKRFRIYIYPVVSMGLTR